MERTAYKGWRDCVRVSNGLVDLVTLAEAGPRIIRFGFVGEENEFLEHLSPPHARATGDVARTPAVLVVAALLLWRAISSGWNPRAVLNPIFAMMALGWLWG